MTDTIEFDDDIGADEWASENHCQNARRRKRAWLAAKVEQFLAKGGQIQQIEIGAITLEHAVPTHVSTFHLTAGTKKSRERAAAEAERLDGILRDRPDVTADEVCQMLAIDSSRLQRLICGHFHADPRAQHLRRFQSFEAKWQVKEHRDEIMRLYNEALAIGLDNRRAIAAHMNLKPATLLKFARMFHVELPMGKQGRAAGSLANLKKGRAK